MNVFILTEEKPKASVIKQLFDIYHDDFGVNYSILAPITIKPIFIKNKFTFDYNVEGIKVDGIENIFIKTVSGESSFLDFLFYVQNNAPLEGSKTEEPLFAVEETKTSGAESRNTNAYQRGTKFIYFRHFFPAVPAYMLYNDELSEGENKTPTDTEVFGTRTLMTLGVKYVGKKMFSKYVPFRSLDELIDSKNSMDPPPAGNTPVRITKESNRICISGTLSKPVEKGNIGHDPNIGCLSMISAAIRSLGWKKDIVITQSKVKQSYIDGAKVINKFLYVCELLNLKIDGVVLKTYQLPDKYWHYERSSEKMASILFHVSCEYIGLFEVYQNHAGCERGYFKPATGELITIPKYCGEDSSGVTIALEDKNTPCVNKRNLLIPDVIMRDESRKIIYLIEGKKLSTIKEGLAEIKLYDDIENLYVKKYFSGYTIKRYLTIFGGNYSTLVNNEILLYLADDGTVIINNSEASLKNELEKTAF